MRKLMLVSLLALGLNQANAGTLGLHLGSNFADVKASVGSTAVASTSKTRLALGVSYELPLIEWLSLQPGLFYIGKGAGNVSLDYLTVPVLAKAKIPTGSIATPFILAGPEVGFKIGSSAAGATIPDGIYKGLDFGLDFGGGVDFEVSPGTAIGVTALYNLGLSNYAGDTLKTTLGSDYSQKNKGIYLLANVTFAL